MSAAAAEPPGAIGAPANPRHERVDAGLWMLVPMLVLGSCSAPDATGLFSLVGSASPAPASTPVDAGAEREPSTSPLEAPAAPDARSPEPPTGENADAPPELASPTALDDGAGLAPTPVSTEAADAGPDAGTDVPSAPVPVPVGIAFDASEACSLPQGAPEGAVLFSGAVDNGNCRVNLDPPFGTFWYSYQDSEAAPAVSQGAQAPGCSDDACSLRVQGPIEGAADFSAYGAGVGFPLAPEDGVFDASHFLGFQYWARGTIEGARGPGNSRGPQMVRLKMVTLTNRLGDDFGTYCQVDPLRWTLCRQDFSELARDGYVSVPDPTQDAFDPSELVRIEFEFPLYRDAAGDVPTPLRFDIELAAISFF